MALLRKDPAVAPVKMSDFDGRANLSEMDNRCETSIVILAQSTDLDACVVRTVFDRL